MRRRAIFLRPWSVAKPPAEPTQEMSSERVELYQRNKFAVFNHPAKREQNALSTALNCIFFRQFYPEIRVMSGNESAPDRNAQNKHVITMK